MKINVASLPEEGLDLEGELDQEILQEGAKYETYAGPIQYSLHADNNTGGLLVTGSLHVPVDLRCVRCDNTFRYDLGTDEFTYFDDEVKGDEAELAEPIREELLMLLPAYPHCDVEGGVSCPGHALLEKNHEDAEFPPGNEQGGDSRWGGLDKLKLDE
jgi:uncharacterized metal-binding protein YceD (DUF177 family)